MAPIENDEILELFLEESTDNINGLETDFLDIEEAGADIDDDLVNKVFRAIHSIKGGAGFVGLTNIKELSHKMENILNMIRNRELVPTGDIISVLLAGTDRLAHLLENALESNEIEIDDTLKQLDDSLSEDKEVQQAISEGDINIKIPNSDDSISIPTLDLSQFKKGGNEIYFAIFDMVRDIERKGHNYLEFVKELEDTGSIIKQELDLSAVGTLDEMGDDIILPMCILFASIVGPDIIDSIMELPAERIYQLDENNVLHSIVEEEAIKTDAPEVIAPPPAIPTPEPVKEKPAVKSKPAAKKATPAKSANKSKPKAASAQTGSLRVNIKVLDELMTLAGELVLTRNQLLQSIGGHNQDQIEKSSQRVDLVTSELQTAIMNTRMQPIGTVFNKFKRIVHDMSKDLNKEIELEIEGKDVEMDKTIVESIADPMTHLVRNSVDHGIEMPDVRRQSEKALPAKIHLNAYHEAGQVIIEITDDGGGIDPQRIAEKAIEKEWFTANEVKEMSDSELVKLILRPGFSLAKEVTDISGRGVGMDVVNSNLTKLGGTIDINSTVGVGTTIRVKLPLTLAIIPSLIVATGNERFTIPQVNLVELVRIPPEQVKKRIEKVDNASVIRLRNELLPLLRLSEILGMPKMFINNAGNKVEDKREIIHDRRSKTIEDAIVGEEAESQDSENRSEPTDRRGSSQSAVNIIVVNAGDINYGLVVDELLDSEEIVVKPLGYHLRDVQAYAGATILGDGKSALILDIVGISNMMSLRSVKDTAKDKIIAKKVDSNKHAQSLLIVRNAATEYFAIPLGLVSRLEKIHRSEIESPGGQLSIKYRGANLLLFRIEDTAKVGNIEDVEWPYVIVFQQGGREVGIIVSGIVDAIDISVEIDNQTFRQRGILGSARIMEQTTMLLDLYGLVTPEPEATPVPQRVAVSDSIPAAEDAHKSYILVVEDSEFFRSHFKSVLNDAGYEILEAEDGVDGIRVFEEHASEISLILTDIEMPNMDGVEMTKNLRQNTDLDTLPILACTSVAGEMAETRGFEAGLDEYLIKLDREQLIERIGHYLEHGRGKS
ncbi:MAG: chemotaxis protein CheW [Candidatus Marinimicrobia bacterium]|nr:chemotaxis protein CheW [Candidatus Neomarinimicrobiota bacterium]